MKKRMSKKAKSIIAALSVVAVVGVSGLVAYLTDSDEERNTFTIGNVDINVIEENFVSAQALNMTPGKLISKDPKVKNEGTSPVYVYLEVKVPVANIATAQENGVPVAAARTQLFTYDYDSNSWELLSAYTDTTQDGYNKYVYAYKQVLNAGQITPNLFEGVTLANITESIAGEQNIDIKGVAIQANDLPANTTIAQAYGIYLNQNPPTP